MMKNIKRLIMVCLIISFNISNIGCSGNSSCSEEVALSRQKLVYASTLRFDNNYALARHDIVRLDPERFSIIFVNSEEDSLTFSGAEDVFVAWPSIFSREEVEFINRRIYLEGIPRLGRPGETLKLEEFNLTYPITMEDLIHNWENVDNFLVSARMDTFLNSIGRSDEGLRDWQRQWFLFSNRLDMLNEFLKDRDMTEFSLQWPITEQDVLNDSLYVREIMDALLPLEERGRIIREPTAHLFE